MAQDSDLTQQAQELITYLVHVQFVLRAWDEGKYETVYADMVKAGLHRSHQNAAGRADTLPKGAVMGVFTGYNAGDVCAFVRNSVMAVLLNLKLKADVSVIAGEKSAWVVLQT